MKYQPKRWVNAATADLANELLDNKEYFSDVENGYVGLEGGYEAVELETVVEVLGMAYYSEEIDLSLVDWGQLAEVVNANIEDREVKDEYGQTSDRAGA